MPHRRHADKQNSDPALACAAIRERMLALLDADEALDGLTRWSLQEHLDSCSACRREWDWHRRAEQGLRQAKRNVPAPGDLRAGFYARLAASEPPRRLSLLEALRRTPAPALGALSALVILAAGGTLHLPRPEQLQSNAVLTRKRYGSAGLSQTAPMLAPVAAMPLPAVALPPSLVLSGQRLRVAQSSVPTPLHVPQATRLPMTVTPPREPLLKLPHITGHLGQQVAMADTNTAFNYQTRSHDALTQDVSTQPDDRGFAMRSQPLASANRPLATAEQPPAALSESVSGSASGTGFAVGASAGSADGVELHAGRYIAPRAELMREEVSIHLVNARNEEVKAVHVAATPDLTDSAHGDQASIVHIEADADTTTSGAAPPAERAGP